MNNATSMIADTVSVSAPAKINIYLKVFNKQSNGFHTIRSIFQRISISDYISVRRCSDCMTCKVKSPLLDLPKENTLVHAWNVFCKAAKPNAGVEVNILKGVPAGSGLGAGSSDAAALLQAVNTLFQAELTNQQLLELALEVGSDVPFFLGSSAAIVSGRGECITPLKARSDYFGILICPNVYVSTKDAYEVLDKSRNGLVDESAESSAEIIDEYSKPVAQWSFCNDFQPIVERLYPVVKTACSDLYAQGAVFAQMSGSGSAVFGLFEAENAMTAAFEYLAEKWQQCKPFILLA